MYWKLAISTISTCRHISGWLSLLKAFFSISDLATSPLETLVNTVWVCKTSSMSVSLKLKYMYYVYIYFGDDIFIIFNCIFLSRQKPCIAMCELQPHLTVRGNTCTYTSHVYILEMHIDIFKWGQLADLHHVHSSEFNYFSVLGPADTFV